MRSSGEVVQQQRHGYVPDSLELPGSVPMLLSPTQVVSAYFSGVLATVLASWFLTGIVKGTRCGERILVCCVVVLGMTHLVLESYYLLTPHFYRESSPMILPEVWKLFSLADSRYVARNPFVMGVEGVLVVINGPTALLSVFGIMARKAWGYPLLLMFSWVEINMQVVMLVSSWVDANHSVDRFHFWFYYVFFSILYGVIAPAIMALIAWRQTTRGIMHTNKRF